MEGDSNTVTGCFIGPDYSGQNRVNETNEVNEDGLTTIVEKGMNKFTDNNNRISTESAV